MIGMRVHFMARALASAWPDLDDLTEDDVDAQAMRFRGGVNNWVVQTYLRLKTSLASAGIVATIGETLVPACVNVAHRDCLNRLLTPYFRSFVVGIRADRPPVFLCNVEVVQNDLQPRTARTAFVNFWPQPGLVARDAARGSRVERMAYFGRSSSVPAWFHDPAWHAALAAIGVTFEIREARWFDYADVDVVLAHRVEAPTMLRQKPASKLTNAWRAGVPALLADEPAYASLRASDLDYIAIDSPTDVLAALRRLRAMPARYAAMAANGRSRGAAFSVAAVKAQWMRFLLFRVLPEAVDWHAARHGVEAGLAQIRSIARQKLASKRFKRRVELELQQSAATESTPV
jgi:hypothetical protein